jgi:glycerol-3-phosphate acyltransferase PlsX
LLLDCGASVEPKPEYLLQNGIMGSIYVNAVKGVKDPEVRLLNIGAEAEKGDDVHKEAYKLLSACDINFKGNIEGRDVAETDCDVVVTDGFSGNIFLKSSEGAVLALMNQVRTKFTEGILARAGALLAMSKIKEIKALFDYSDVGGAPILGLKGPVVKVHGNSKETEVYYAIIKAVPFVRNDVTGMITEAVKENEALFAKSKEEE